MIIQNKNFIPYMRVPGEQNNLTIIILETIEYNSKCYIEIYYISLFNEYL